MHLFGNNSSDSTFAGLYTLDVVIYGSNISHIDTVQIDTKGEYKETDMAAHYSYGKAALCAFMSGELKPGIFRNHLQNYLVVIEAEVNIDCTLKKFHIARADLTEVAEELIRVLKLTGRRWFPANKERVAISTTLMFVFRINKR